MSLTKNRKQTRLPEGIRREELSRVPFMVVLSFLTREVVLTDLATSSRKRELVETRQLICYFMSIKNLSWTTIGIMIGKDHATAIHGRNAIETLMSLYASWNNRIILLAKEMISYHNKLIRNESKKTDLPTLHHSPHCIVDRAVAAQS